MTCIVAVWDGETVIMGGDSVAARDGDIVLITHPKVFQRLIHTEQNNTIPCLIGYTTSFRMGQIIEYLMLPKMDRRESVRKYLITRFIPCLREAFANGGFLTHDTSGEERGGEFLIGIGGIGYRIDVDFQVIEHKEEYAAIGSGERQATGALYVLIHNKILMKQKVYFALSAAAYHTPYTREPFTILSLAKEEEKEDDN